MVRNLCSVTIICSWARSYGQIHVTTYVEIDGRRIMGTVNRDEFANFSRGKVFCFSQDEVVNGNGFANPAARRL